MNKKLLIQLGLKYNPFGLDLPLEGLLLTRLLEDFFLFAGVFGQKG